MSNTPNIKFILIGNIDTKQVVAEFISMKNDQMKNDSKLIFQKICSSPAKSNFHNRNKIQMSSGYAYFLTYPENKFYLVIAESSYPERIVYEMIEDIDRDNIFLLTTEKGELNASGKQSLKAIVDKYQEINKVNRISEINSDIDEVKLDMQQNIKKATDNLIKVQDLDEKAYKIKLNADSFKNNAKELERKTCLENWKWTFIIGGIVVGLFLIFVVPNL
jgi:hypothetical protein